MVTAGGEDRDVDAVVSCVGPHRTSELLGVRRHAEWPLVREAPIAVVGLGFERKYFPEDFGGYGYLAPEVEDRFCLGCLYSSSIFPNRAPSEYVLLRCIVGGIRHPERLELSDQEMVEKVLADIQPLISISTNAEPEMTHVIRPERGIPQIEVGHQSLREAKAQVEGEYPGLIFSGAGYSGISCNHLVEEAEGVAERVVRTLA